MPGFQTTENIDVPVIFIINLRQLFEVYDVLPDPSLGHMVEVVKGAVNLCSGIYICVGFFGYIAFYTVDFGGNSSMLCIHYPAPRIKSRTVLIKSNDQITVYLSLKGTY